MRLPRGNRSRGLVLWLVAGAAAAVVGHLSASRAALAQAAAGNPCTGANPCAAPSPCSAGDPSNPCAPAPNQTLPDAEAADTYQSILDELQAGYVESGHPVASAYTDWKRYNEVPYVSETHGARLVNNYANDIAAAYGKFEEAGVMPAGSVLAKDSFRVTPEGKVQKGPLFIMEKMKTGFSSESGDWRYTMIMPDGSIYGTTKGTNAAKVKFCADCHGSVGERQDSLFFLPEQYRVE